MTDPTTPGGPTDPPAEDDDDSSSTNTSLGIVFGMLGLVLMLTLDDTRVAGLPFVVLGITFFVMGMRPKKAERVGPAADDTPPPPA
ncbi:hypothetical protein ACR8AL_01040 [Clavibacter sepedonicus]|uniref:Phage-related protein n=1 Tax=Clavibacter sepedonicus TaxID=31964 RepID=B0REZ9_CLASE|nr:MULTISPECIES: hypothetical protein [Clavibacter]MBD5382997.1 hypothetical protein [Clavibacter sp.]OQJ49293.1 hypothetical protein B5P19_14395 [Clavibacter sepedonicus]OQJ54908.1 hypothetical protein B5P20_12975 [Clavibacter sepedonicus]UUK64862.1 hypothetical protein LRE50_11255 [Clavibacter sepedonicus]CAQ00932.1 putative phage-related protein [Clavibacter sepedonicus]